MVGGSGVRCALGALVTCLAIAFGAGPALAQAPVKVLVFSGPSDPTTTAGVDAIKDLGAANGFGVDATGSPAQLNTATLAGYRALVFLNTAGSDLSTAQDAAVEAYVKGGGGFLGIGSAAQTESGVPFFDQLIGARPSAQSPAGTSEQTVVAGDRVHPSTRNLPLA